MVPLAPVSAVSGSSAIAADENTELKSADNAFSIPSVNTSDVEQKAIGAKSLVFPDASQCAQSGLRWQALFSDTQRP